MKINLITHEKSAVETLAVIVPSLFLTYIATKLSSASGNNVVIQFILDFSVISLPIILITTLGFEYLLIINLVLVLLSVLITLILNDYRTEGEKKGDGLFFNNVGKMPFITNARSTINIITAVAILAVDFRIFPRTFQKTERYGISLMDVGVGLFVYANGIVAPEIRRWRNSAWKTILNVTPLLIIGVARFIITTQIDYSVPVTEYGKHWNFFITLAVTKLISSIIFSLTQCNMIICAFQGISILCLHQVLLNCWFEEIVFSSEPRDTFFLANREGIASSLGYAGLYFLSVAFGFLISRKNKKAYELFLCTALIGVATLILHSKFNISRCLANSTYCLWVLFIGTLMTSLFYLMEQLNNYLCQNSAGFKHVPFIYDAINYNGLTFFLIANVLTGLVNIVFETRNVPDFYSILIISCYMLTVSFVLCFLYVKKIRIKL